MITLLIKTQQMNYVKALVKLLMKTMLYCSAVRSTRARKPVDIYLAVPYM